MEGRVSRFRTYLEPTLLLPIPMPMGAFVFEMVVLHTSHAHKYLSYFGLVRNRREFVSVHQIELLPMGKQYHKNALKIGEILGPIRVTRGSSRGLWAFHNCASQVGKSSEWAEMSVTSGALVAIQHTG